MAQGCLKCLKYTMCAVNFLCFMCGVAVLGFGVFLMVNFQLAALTPDLVNINIANMLLISGIAITCVSFLGFLGALKENRCLLLTFFLLIFVMMLVELAAACLLLIKGDEIGEQLPQELMKGLNKVKTERINSTSGSDWDWFQNMLDCCGVNNYTDWEDKIPTSCCQTRCDVAKPPYKAKGCLEKLRIWYEGNFLHIGVGIITLCVIEVLAMCFAMTLFCHISRSGLGYKL